MNILRFMSHEQFVESLHKPFRGDIFHLIGIWVQLGGFVHQEWVGIGVLTMVRGGNKGPQVIFKYFEDLVHECSLKAPKRPSKRSF
jgi:hypothetical protein